ncbi:lipoprotein N-acyltransferase Lnb domain-containing protein [Ulvibacter antarcticus]|uniref:lipoprotein N-acyltransferase Lnb domain-containing protein n=1 Tax=Ulvibacter antarcticus TaxID=442714 RepID=UPI000EF9A465|nr:DUF4105 domain-containing protein [Ulvibacter antarcticus]
MIKKFILLLVLLTTLTVEAQFNNLSENAEISILTIGPGTQLNDSFGHNGYHVSDPSLGIDLVYDYGRYDFNTPNFYLKFAQGKLLYELGVSNYNPFVSYYKGQNRWVKKQVLDLTSSEKQELFDFLQNNAKPENKKYKYDFFYDNCATRMRDVLSGVLGDKLEYKTDHIIEDYTFRQLIQKNVNANSWGSLGMDVAIGAVVDRKASPLEYQFLPEYVFKAAENAVIHRNGNDVPLVKQTVDVVSETENMPSSNFFTSPLFIFGCLGLLIVFTTIRDNKKQTRSRFLDLVIFFVTGIIGILLLLLWFATDHSATANNYNLLWAVPLSLIFIFAIIKRHPKTWLRRYVLFLILCLTLLTIHWITGVQEFAIGLLPLLIALGIRYLYLMQYFGKHEVSSEQ